MSRYVSMLRGVNVTGRRRLVMADLRDVYTSLGFTRVESYVQSGNVVFESGDDRRGLSDAISDAIAANFGYDDVTVFVRTESEISEVVGQNPFVQRAEDPKSLHVTFLGNAVEASTVAALDPDAYVPDEFVLGDQAVYVFCPGGYGRTKLNNAYFERKFGVAATTRNLKTVQRLLEMLRR